MDPHITVDDKGVARLDGSRAKVYQIAIDHIHNGDSPEQIHEYHPHLPLAQIQSALAYYYDHREEIDADIARREAAVDKLRAEATGQLTRSELLERLRQRGISLHPDNEYARSEQESSDSPVLHG